MTDLSFDELFEPEDIDEAISYLETRKDSCGVDGIYLSELREYWLINGADIIDLLRMEKYTPGIVRNTEIVNYKGKKRTISLFNSLDRLILRCLSQNIQAIYDEVLDEHCFAYRTGYGIEAAVSKESDYLGEGFLWTVKVDISGYFDNIVLDRMEKQLKQMIADERICHLICRYLHVNIEEDGKIKRKERGLIQGSPLSPFLSNLYLEPFDRKMSEEGMKFCRFGDDIIFNFDSVEKAEDHFGKVRAMLKADYGLQLNEEKSGVFEGLDQKYLGYRFRKDKKSGKILAARKEKKHDSLMLAEARGREHYYARFNDIIKDDGFKYNGRTRRPPKDPLNALISFGNVYMYNRVATEIHKTSLDIRIGIIHSTNTRSQTLNLDIAEIFKPLIVDRTIFTLINKKMIDAEEHFEKTNEDGVYLNSRGKRLYINSLDEKIYTKITDRNQPVSYDTRIREEVSKIFRAVIYGEKYKPYKYQ